MTTLPSGFTSAETVRLLLLMTSYPKADLMSDDHPAVDAQHLSGYEGRILRSQEGYGLCRLLVRVSDLEGEEIYSLEVLDHSPGSQN